MKRVSVFLGCTVSVLLLASPAGSSDRNGAAACSAIQVTSPDAPAKTQRRSKKAPTFSAAAILDLKLEATLSPAVKGQHQVEFKVFTPKGHLYQSLTATSASSTTSAQGGRQRTGKKTAAAVMLPVAGTTIVTNSLYGRWKVEAFLDGDRDAACAKPLAFVIEP